MCPTRWRLWSLPSRVLLSVLLVELLAVVLVVVSAVSSGPELDYERIALTCASLLVLSVIHTELSVWIERRRRLGSDAGHIDFTSVWTFSAALVLPTAFACATAVALYAYSYVRVWRPARTPLFKHVFSTATVILAMQAAAAVAEQLRFLAPDGGPLQLIQVLTAMLAYTVVNSCLVVGIVVLNAHRSIQEILGSGDEILLEVATLSLGGIAAVMLAELDATLLFILPPVVLLHRAVLARSLETAANTDSKTGLLRASAWEASATRRLKRAGQLGRTAAVLLVDLDHFKRVNDTHGHLVGDSVLNAVAQRLRDCVGDQDLVGRFGGEEFVLLLGESHGRRMDVGQFLEVAEKVRSGIAGLTVEVTTPDGPLTLRQFTVSGGGAMFPTDGSSVEELMRAADRALYDAKNAGRNLMRLYRGPAARSVRGVSGPST